MSTEHAGHLDQQGQRALFAEPDVVVGELALADAADDEGEGEQAAEEDGEQRGGDRVAGVGGAVRGMKAG